MEYFYPKTFKYTTTAILDIFNDIQVKIINKAGGTVKTINPVPITLGPGDKRFAYRKEGESAQSYYLQLPRIAVVPTGITYNRNRVKGANEKRYLYDSNSKLHDLDSFFTDAEPAPFDFTYNVELWAIGIDDFAQMVEQILPYFNPTLNLRIKEVFNETLNIERNILVSMQGGVQFDFTMPQQENQRREIKGIIGITAEGYMYLPSTTTQIIKTIHSKYYLGSDMTDLESSAVYLIEEYLTSGITATSAGTAITSAIPNSDTYSFSGYDESMNIYWFTSASNYDIP